MKKLPLVLTGILLLGGCSSNKLATSGVEDKAKQQALNSTITPEQAVAQARKAMDQATADDLAFYTPLHFKNAQESLTYIEKLQNGEESADGMSSELAIITAAFKTQELINEAYKTKQLIEQTLSDSLAHKTVLDELEVKKEFPKSYGDMNEDLGDLFKLIEQNKVEEARNDEADLLADMAHLEINTLIKRNVTPAQLVLDKAEDEDADDYAELTFEQAENSIERAKAFINKNYRDRVQVVKVGKEALIAAQRAFNIGKESQSMVKLDEEKAEQKALEMESLIKVIRSAMKANNIEGLSIQEQAAELAAMATLSYRQAEADISPEISAEEKETEQAGSNDSVLTPLDTSFMKSFDKNSAQAESEQTQSSAPAEGNETEETNQVSE